MGVRFIYRAKFDDEGSELTDTANNLAAAYLSSLPSELVTKLNQAAIAVDGSQIEQSIAQIPYTQQHIVETITQMLARYDFDAIIELTEA